MLLDVEFEDMCDADPIDWEGIEEEQELAGGGGVTVSQWQRWMQTEGCGESRKKLKTM